MMGIAQKVSRVFSDAVRSRGQSYFAKGRVALSSATAGEVIARVRGTAKYRVRLRVRGTKLHIACSCPYFGPTGEPCKHIWATVLMADARGLLQAAPVRPLKLVSDLPRRPAAPEGGLPPAAGHGPGPGPGHGTGSGPGGPPQRPGRYRKDRTARGVAPHWGAGVGAGAGKDAAGGPRAKAVNRNSKRLLIYILDVPATLNQNQVVVDLARRQRRPTGDWGPLKPWWHAPGSPHAKYDPEDRDLLTLLEETQAASHGNGMGMGDPTMGTRRYVLRTNQALIVERLARSGRLRLRRTEGEDDPPTMRWDDGPPWRFALDIRPELGGKRWSWRGSLRRGDGRNDRMDLAEPLVLVPAL
jgi:hypothetical protein